MMATAYTSDDCPILVRVAKLGSTDSLTLNTDTSTLGFFSTSSSNCLTLGSVLANASVSWCSVTVNREVLQRLLNQAQDVEKEIATVDRMLRLGASTEMVSRFYGLTHQEVALRREVLGLPKRKGRHPVLDETQDTELWRQWKAVTSSRNVGG